MAKRNHLGALVAATGATLVAVGLLVLMMLVVEVQPAEATFPGKNGKIAYSGSDGHDREIYTIDPGGGNRFNVTNNKTDDIDPAYSPNGKKIAYAGRQGKEWEIYTINATGGSRFNVTNDNTGDYYPTYAPSGKKIAYSARHGKDLDIFTINVRGGGRFNVTNNRGPLPKGPGGNPTTPDDYSPTYSPSGKKIAFGGACGDECTAIYTTNVGGGSIFRITAGLLVLSPDYSPSGKKIAYTNSTRLETRNVGGGGRFVVTKGSSSEPSYSPDGKKIAYSGWDGNDWEIYTINAGGGGKFQLTNNTTNDTFPSWGSR
jgi:TolB protein